MKRLKFPALFLLLAGLLGGCATAEGPRQQAEAPTVEALLAEARTASKAGRGEQALAALRQAAAAFPADKRPWLDMAQMHFDAAEYAAAILSAEEVLQRDPEDQVATSIIAVSGLRLSTKAIADLSRQNNLSGSLRTEAQELAKLLRETLGEPVLIPPPTRSKTTSAPPPVQAVPAKRRATPARGENPGANPFEALK